MGSKAEIERIRSLEHQTPLRLHSMNQQNLKASRDGEQRIGIPRKQLMAERRRQKTGENRQPVEDKSAIEVTGTTEEQVTPRKADTPAQRFLKRYRY